MAKADNFHRFLIRVCVAFGWILLMAGCDVATTPVSPVDLSTSSADLTTFIQQFAREAIAAFLF